MSIMRFGASVTLLTLSFWLHAQGPAKEAHSMGLFKTYHDDESLATFPVLIDVPDLSTEGGEAIGYFTDEDHRIIAAHLWLFGETGRSFTSFYYRNDSLALCVETTCRYDRPISTTDPVGNTVANDPTKTTTTERWSYFSKNARYFTESTGALRAIGSGSDKELLAQANDIRNRLERSKRIGTTRSRMFRSSEIAHILDTLSCAPNDPDTVLGSVALLNGRTVLDAVGPLRSEELSEDNRDMPQVSFASADGSEFLTLFFHYGGVINEFSELRVGNEHPAAVKSTLPANRFVSNSGIVLGMTENEARTILGDQGRNGMDDKGHRYLRYFLNDMSASGFLRRYNYPSYYAVLEFASDSLVEYRFGFDYP